MLSQFHLNRLFHFWPTVVFGRRRPFGPVVSCGCNQRVVSTARTRVMTAHGMPEHADTVPSTDVFNNGTDTLRFYGNYFCIGCRHFLGVSEQRRVIVMVFFYEMT